MVLKQFELFKNIPTIETERLRLRKIQPSDAENVYEYASRPLVSEFLLWYPHENLDYTRNYLARIKKEYARKRFYDWAIALKDSDKMIGTCGFTSIYFEENSAEVGYVLSDLYWKNGYATEALREVLKFGFLVLDFDSLSAKIMSDNKASINVAKKNKFVIDNARTEKLWIKNEYRTILTYVLNRRTYFSRHL